MVQETDTKTMPRDETHNLIASDRVEGTAVYNRDGEKLGTISKFMVGKRSGQVQYAVMGFGGLFGMGERDYPLPWNALAYDPEKGGYVVDLDKDRLKDAPSFERGADPSYDRDYGEQVFTYYGIVY